MIFCPLRSAAGAVVTHWRSMMGSLVPIELVSNDLTLLGPKIQTSKLNQSTRVVKIDVYYTILRLKELLVQKLSERVWKFGSFSDKIRVKSSATSSK